MLIKTILNPKEFIKDLSWRKIEFKLVLIIFLVYVLTVSLSFFGFSSVFNDLISIIKSTLAPLNQLQGAEKSLAIFRISRDVVFMFGMSLFVYVGIYVGIIVIGNLFVKGVALIFKKEITFIALLNISIYSLLAMYFLKFILSLCLVFAIALVGNFTENQVFLFVALPASLINIFSFGLYVYSVIVTVERKEVK